MDRIPASERTRERLKALMEGHGEKADLRSELVRLAARLIVEEGQEGETADALGREYYVRGAAAGAGYRNGYRRGRLKTAEGVVEYAAPQICDRAVPFRSRLREIIRGRTEELEALAVEMYARGLSTRDIEALFADEDGRSLLSRTAVSEVTERLWAEYEAFASRDLSEFEVIYLFVDGIAERLHLGQPREAVLTAWGVLADGIRSFSTWRQGARHGELPRVLPGHATARLARSAAGHLRRRARPDPRDRGMLPALGAATLSRPQAAQSAEQGAGGAMAGVQGARHCLLPGRLAGARPYVAGRHCDDLRHRLAVSADVLAGRLRGVHCAPTLPARAPAFDSHDQPA